MFNLALKPLDNIEVSSSCHMPFLTSINGDKFVIFCKKTKESPDAAWKLHYGKIDENGFVSEVSMISTGLADDVNENFPSIFKRNSDDKYVLTFIAVSRGTAPKSYQMSGVDITSLDAPQMITTFDLTSICTAQNNKFKVCCGTFEDQESTESVIKIQRASDNHKFVLVHPFTAISKVGFSVSDPNVLLISASVQSNEFTFGFDLDSGLPLGYLLVASSSVLNASIFNENAVIFSEKMNFFSQDWVVKTANSFMFADHPELSFELVDITDQ
jgi:hypothetical protein